MNLDITLFLNMYLCVYVGMCVCVLFTRFLFFIPNFLSINHTHTHIPTHTDRYMFRNTLTHTHTHVCTHMSDNIRYFSIHDSIYVSVKYLAVSGLITSCQRGCFDCAHIRFYNFGLSPGYRQSTVHLWEDFIH